MRLLLIGAPGCGKGTQATRIAAYYGIEHISSGDLLRRHVADGTAIGRTVEEYLDRGDLVPGPVVMDMLREPVEAASRRGGYILDGFPRTVEQAEAADPVAESIGASVEIALYLKVPRETLIQRLLGRGSRTGRSDDTEQVINHRLAVFEESSGPLLACYAVRRILITVDADGPVGKVTGTVVGRLDRAGRPNGDAHPPARRTSR